MLLAFAFFVATRIAAIPASTWEFDEPLFILTGKLVSLVAPSEFSTLIAISFCASLLGFVLLAMAFRNIGGDERIGIAGALLFYFSPGMLLHSTMPISDPGALCLLAATLFFSSFLTRDDSRRSTELAFAAFAALTVGWRPQFSIVILPLFFTTLALLRTWRARFVAVATFTVVCILWLIPLVVSVGGVRELIDFETGQAQYLAAQDADESRGNWSAPQIAARFIAHPWGTKVLAAPILVLALVGLWWLATKRTRAFLPIAVAGLVYLTFALAVMDPADGVRYALPFTLVAALLAAAGAIYVTERTHHAIPSYALVAAFALGAMAYVSLGIVERRTTTAPPMRAVAYARATFPPNAVVLYDQALWPHARHFLTRFHPQRIDKGLAAYVDRADVPLFILADGHSNLPGTRTFTWTAHDAYSKLTRNHYRVVSVSPLPPQKRFAIVSGVYAPERLPEGEEWRWLAGRAEIRLPNREARAVRLRLGLPVLYPYPDNKLTISVDGAPARTLHLQKATSHEIVLPVTRPGAVVRFEAAREFVPMHLPNTLFRDPRRLAVKLYDVETQP